MSDEAQQKHPRDKTSQPVDGCTPQRPGEGAPVTPHWAESSLPSCCLFLGATSLAVLAFSVFLCGRGREPRRLWLSSAVLIFKSVGSMF